MAWTSEGTVQLSASHSRVITELYVDGQSAIRAKYPNGDPSTHGRHTQPSGLLPPPVAINLPLPAPPAVDVIVDSPIRNGTAFPNFQLGIGGSRLAHSRCGCRPAPLAAVARCH